MTIGLTLGKFAPLHRGHQLVIERALAENDHVIVLAYDAPEATQVPLPVRVGWIRQLYPTVEVIEARDGPSEVGRSPSITQLHDEYLKRTLEGRQITHFYSSEFYGEHVSRALGARDCRVDEARLQVPISATEIRRDPFANRQYLSPVVYRDLITKVVLVGAPSTGKTTLAEALAQKFNTCWMPEYGREYWEQHQVERRLTPEQLVEIAEGHIEREEALVLESNRYLFVDTDATTTFMFSQYYHGTAHPRLAELAEQAGHRYDLVFLCGDDIPYDATWDRSGEVNRALFQRQIRADLCAKRRSYTELTGSLEARLQGAVQSLRSFV